MKSPAITMLGCLGFLLLTAMGDKKHHDPMSSWVKLSGSDGKDVCVNEKGEFFMVNTANKRYKLKLTVLTDEMNDHYNID